MIILNGTIETETHALATNRGFKFGDAVFETMRINKGKLLYAEDHYFRLMAAMRIMRMEIPMPFTLEFFEAEVVRLVTEKGLEQGAARARFTVYRDAAGLYTPNHNEVAYLIEASALEHSAYVLQKGDYEVDLYKDFYVSAQLLSTIKTNNKAINVIAGIFAKENELDNCLLLNEKKQVVEALNGNLFLVKGNTIKTPPIEDGCLKGILRKQLIAHIQQNEDLELVEASISPFELQKADELFITNVIQGIVSISKYRKKQFSNAVAELLTETLNGGNESN